MLEIQCEQNSFIVSLFGFSFSWGCGWSIGHLLRGGVLLSKLFESSQSRCVSWPRTDKNDKNSGKNGHFNMISKSFRYEVKLIAWCAFPIVSMAICRAAGVFLSNWKCIADLKKNDGNLRVYFVNGSVMDWLPSVVRMRETLNKSEKSPTARLFLITISKMLAHKMNRVANMGFGSCVKLNIQQQKLLTKMTSNNFKATCDVWISHAER